MSTMNYIATSDELTSVADAIRTKGGTSSLLEFPDGFISAIEDIPTGGTTVEPKDVNFIDYDGTIVAAYTAQEFAALDALPENPTHEGLTAQGWNWSLSDAKTYVAAYGKLWVGQTYITDDGKTRVYISLPGAALSPTLRLAVNGSAVVDWGDESPTDTLTGSSTSTVLTVQHTYATPGDYVISIDVTGKAAGIGSDSQFVSILGGNPYYYYVKKIEIGNNFSIGDSCFFNLYNLISVTIPIGVTTIKSAAFKYCIALHSVVFPSGETSINTGGFQNCYSLRSVAIPSSMELIANSAFYSCYALTSITIPGGATYVKRGLLEYCSSLRSVVIPSGITSIENEAFKGCYSLSSVVIPSGVTSIGNDAFSNCLSIVSYHVKPTTPPTLGTNAFTGIPATCTIYVPAASLETYKTASGWSTYASQMVGE